MDLSANWEERGNQGAEKEVLKEKSVCCKIKTLKLRRLTKRYNDGAGDAVGHTD